ncbi:sensor histidine kinase [Agromyces sp. MMS24-K17]|uniref:sensor histidine kinase n=1 Tax=Agromyces sp. MMS24-K17 TaxID=3372850 RepID=UPI0037542A14
MTSPLRALWHAPAAVPAPPRRVWRDWVLVGALPLVALLEAATRTDVPSRWFWAIVLIALVPTLLWRRTRPFTMLAIAFGAGTACSVVVGAESPLFTTAYFLVLVYAVMRWGSGRAMLGGGALVIAGTLLSLVFESPTPGDVIGGIAVVVTTCTLGVAFRWRAGARARELDRIRLLERERLARDLHDTVAHHVSAIAVQAQAGTIVAPADPAAAAEVLRVIEGEAARTLDEMRAMVRVLRRDESDATGAAGAPEVAPTPGLDDVRRLAAPDATPRVDVVVEVAGEASGSGSDALPPAVAAAVFRIAQEAVTNARRHARDATRIAVRVGVDAAGVRLQVRDDGTTAAPAGPEASASTGASGYGLTGMAERAALLGGTCTAGPAPDGGWAVVAVLPRAGWAG